MNKLHRYILREFFPPLLVGTAFFTFVFILPPIKNLVNLTLEKGIPFSVAAQLFLYSLPFTGAITLPMGVLFGSLFAIVRLSGDNEVTALRSVGFSYFTLAWPALLFGMLMTVFTFFFINFVMPESNTRYKLLYANVVYSNPSILVENRTFRSIPNTDKKITALELNEAEDLMTEVFLYELDKKTDEITLTYAKNGRWLNNAINAKLTSLELRDGESIQFSRKLPSEMQRLKFSKIIINILNNVKELKETVKNPREQSVFEIKQDMLDTQQRGESISPITHIEYHKKFSLPLACIVFTIVTLPLGISLKRGGKGVSFGVAIIVIFVYYFIMTTAETLGKRGHLDPVLSTYVPTALFALFAIILAFLKLRR